MTYLQSLYTSFVFSVISCIYSYRFMSRWVADTLMNKNPHNTLKCLKSDFEVWRLCLHAVFLFLKLSVMDTRHEICWQGGILNEDSCIFSVG